jgi:hypothetical protein
MAKPVSALLAEENLKKMAPFFISLSGFGIKRLYLDYVKLGLIFSVMFFFHVTRHSLP